MQGVILAAGKGSRLHPITVARSKAIVPILGKPIVERVMETLAENGVDDSPASLALVIRISSAISRGSRGRTWTRALPIK